ncbi:hypothetical protein [Caulobacter radicis]|uniref:Uncharacterized protein n=1 Tax=Caulobacter radicis TaxID=2172650 RepID=A0A2T9JYL0_9CAUL|nr:hypothetical protein DDF65_01275 [Caulobacter radicis]
MGYKADLNLYAYVDGDPLNATDPSGENPLLLALAKKKAQDVTVGTLIGGVVGAGSEALAQKIEHGRITDRRAVLNSGLSGAGAGGLGSLINLGGPVGQLAKGAAMGVADKSIKAGLEHRAPTQAELASGAGWGALGSLAGGQVAQRLESAVINKLQENAVSRASSGSLRDALELGGVLRWSSSPSQAISTGAGVSGSTFSDTATGAVQNIVEPKYLKDN